jgi:hypothetical protein
LALGTPVLASPPLSQVHHLLGDDLGAAPFAFSAPFIFSDQRLFVNVGGIWYAPTAYARHAGAWKLVTSAYRRSAAGGWLQIYEG